jgi:hypothetical protein
VFTLEYNPVKNNKVIAINSKNQQKLSKIHTFDLEGQGHLRIKVKFSLVYLKVLSQGLLWPSMKTIYQGLKKL